MQKVLEITYTIGLKETNKDDMDIMNEIDEIFEESIEKVISQGHTYRFGHMQIKEKE